MADNDDYVIADEEPYDVLVIGAGISGLIAARELKKLESAWRIKVIEAKDRIGGRTKTITLKAADGGEDKWDIGGQWVGRTQRHILKLLEELGVEKYDQFSDGTKWMQIGQHKPRTYQSELPKASEIGQYSVFELVNFLIAYPRLLKLVESVNLRNLHETPNAKQLDALTVEEWFRQNGSIRFFTDIGDVSTMSVYGVPSARMSMLYYLYYAKAAGSLEDLFECTKNGAQAFRIKGGVEQVTQKLVDQIGADSVELNEAVLEIDYSNESMATVIIQSRINKTKVRALTARRIILAISPSECSRIRFTPAMPYVKKQLFDGAPQGNLLKFVVTYETPFWRAKGFSGEILSSGATDFKGEVLPLVCVYDGMTSNGNPALVGFIHNDFWSDQTLEVRKQGVLRDLARFLGDEALTPIDYIDKDWQLEPYSGGCPASVIPAGNMSCFAHIRVPVAMIHFAGTETATEWVGYMSGAVQAGLRAAHEVLLNLKSLRVDRRQLKDSVYASDYQPPRDSWDRSYPPPSRISFSRLLFVSAAIIASGVFLAKKYHLFQKYFSK